MNPVSPGIASTPVHASPPAHASPSASARDRVRPLLPDDVRHLVSDEVLDTPIGSGTVASEYDRAVVFGIEGSGPASARDLVPRSTTAVGLRTSAAWPRFEALVRASLGVADAANGADNLASLTLVPDEQSATGVELMRATVQQARSSGEEMRFTSGDPTTPEAVEIRRNAVDTTREKVTNLLRTMEAGNDAGHIVVAPAVARDILAAVGAYRPDQGDMITGMQPDQRVKRSFENVDSLVHEVNHSVTPSSVEARADPLVGRWEEALAVVMAAFQTPHVSRAAGIEPGIQRLAVAPESVPDGAKLGWRPWNRDHLPAVTAADGTRTQAVYVDGPGTVAELLSMAHIDIRKPDGQAAASHVLQGADATKVPERLAGELAKAYGLKLDGAQTEQLAGIVQSSLDASTASVHDALRALAITTLDAASLGGVDPASVPIIGMPQE